MIVQRKPPHLVLVTQPDHAALSADLMSNWRDPRWHAVDRQDDILLAIREHDNGWLEPDDRPTVDNSTGQPHDFVMLPIADRQAVWPRAIARLQTRSTGAAAFLAEHALTVFKRYRQDSAWTAFFESIARVKNDLLEKCGRVDAAQRAAFEADYSWLHLADLLSLIFCNGWTDQFDDAGYRIILTGDRLLVKPDPFDGHVCRFQVRARMIPDRRYLSDDDLRDTLARSPDSRLAGSAAGHL